jgi:hypothetical protein
MRAVRGETRVNIEITTDAAGHLLCTIDDGVERALVTASDAPEAGDALMAALDDTRDTGRGECLWNVPGGEYRWMFRRDGDRLTVAVMWTAGVVTGWQHVFRSDCEAEPFVEQVQAALAAAVVAGSGER